MTQQDDPVFEIVCQAAEIAHTRIDPSENPIYNPSRKAYIQMLCQIVEIAIKEFDNTCLVLFRIFIMFRHDREAYASMMLVAIRDVCLHMPNELITPVIYMLLDMGANKECIEFMTKSLANSWLITRAKANLIAGIVPMDNNKSCQELSTFSLA